MSEYGRKTYGDPCRECGFVWSIGQADAAELVTGIPRRLGELLAGLDASLRHPDLSWSVGAYVCHVADNLRIWAERLAGQALGATGPVSAFDQDRLADVRNYDRIPIEAALWSLRRAVGDWEEAIMLVADKNITLHHPERGAQTLLDGVRSNSHDAHHHVWDIQRAIDRSRR